MRVLIADDTATSRLILQRTLAKWGYQVVSCSDGESAWSELQKPEAPRLAILDWIMPGLSGTEICELIRARKDTPYTYILLLTSKNERQDIVTGMEAGADDYLTKPFDQNELKVRLRAGTRILDLETALVAAREALLEQAMRDSLTGLWNRRSILEIVEREQSRGAREHNPLGILMVDLDHFKSVNDRYGHLVGDGVLQESARRLLGSVRPYDGVGRYGGEEFLMVLPGCDETALYNRAESIRTHIASEPMVIGEYSLRLTGSFGATVWVPGEMTSVTQLISIADMALYDAKHAGRNCVQMRSTTERRAVAPTSRGR